MRSKRLCPVPTACLTISTRRSSKRSSKHCTYPSVSLTFSEEEPAEQEFEVPSYLQHAAPAPSQIDFVDELPSEPQLEEAEGKVRAA